MQDHYSKEGIKALLASLVLNYPEVEDAIWNFGNIAMAKRRDQGSRAFDESFVDDLTKGIEKGLIPSFKSPAFCYKLSHFDTDDLVDVYVRYLKRVEQIIS